MIKIKCNRGDTSIEASGNEIELIAEATILIERLLKSLGDHVEHQAAAAVLGRVTTDFASKSGVFGQGVPHE